MTFHIESGIPIPLRQPQREHVCSFCGDVEHYYAKGLCRNCYTRNLKSGYPEYSVYGSGLSIDEKIRHLSKQEDECLLWEGSCNGKIPWFGGRNVRSLICENHRGKQPEFTRYLAICGNDRCICPEHIAAKVPLPEQEAAAIISRVQDMPKREAVRAMRSAGLTLQRIGDALGFSRERARQLLGEPTAFKRKQMEDRATHVAELLGQALTFGEIGRHLGLNYGEMRRIINHYLELNGEHQMEYMHQLKSRRDELQAKVDEFMPVMEELRRVKAGIAALEPRPRSAASKGAGETS